MHPEAYRAVGRMVKHSGINVEEPWMGLDVGGASWNGTARDHLPNARWTILELAPTQYEALWDQYVIGDATTWRPSHDGFTRFDVVLCTELLEHVEQWPAVIETLAHAVKPGGIVMLTCASTGRPVHGATGTPQPLDDEWYANVDVPDLEVEFMKWFGDFKVDYQWPPGDAYAFARGPLV